MSTPQFRQQFNLNMETIAKFAGLEPMSYKEDKTPKCPDCGGEDGFHYCQCNKEITKDRCRNGGVCNECL